MKLQFLWEMKINELDARLITDLIISIIMFLGGIFFDPIAEIFQIKHNSEYFPLWQIIWCGFWGLYFLWTIKQLRKWGE